MTTGTARPSGPGSGREQKPLRPAQRSRVTKDGLSVPFDAQKIMSGPEVTRERHMSSAQTIS